MRHTSPSPSHTHWWKLTFIKQSLKSVVPTECQLFLTHSFSGSCFLKPAFRQSFTVFPMFVWVSGHSSPCADRQHSTSGVERLPEINLVCWSLWGHAETGNIAHIQRWYGSQSCRFQGKGPSQVCAAWLLTRLVAHASFKGTSSWFLESGQVM